MIEVTSDVSINENDISIDFIRSSGPGGQNVNKVASGVQLRYNIASADTLPDEVKQRLYSIARNRITEEGVLIIEAKRFRTQEQNREDAVARLVALVYQATEKPKARKKTRPSAASQEARIEEKKHRGSIKRLRRGAPQDFE
jgi:ribosome-associated protein